MEREKEPSEDDIIADMVGRVAFSVPADVKQKLTALSQRYSSVIFKNEWELGWTKLIYQKNRHWKQSAI